MKGTSSGEWLEQLEFSMEAARRMIVAFHGGMRRGLAGDGSTLPMLPTYTTRPRGDERGTYLVVDLGGTNLRVMTVHLDGQGGAASTAIQVRAVPAALLAGPGEKLFAFIADWTVAFVREHRILTDRGLAFTFSFPVAQTSVNTGRLIRWTKGFACPDTVGQDVVALFKKALEKRGLADLPIAALTNDTVGVLMAAAYGDPTCDLGVVLGTGTNACYPEKGIVLSGDRGGFAGEEMIINIEWGKFDGLDLTPYDRLLDKSSPNPGEQLLEKQVSALYIGELVRLILRDLTARGEILRGRNLRPLEVPLAVKAEFLEAVERGEDLFGLLGIAETTERDRRIARRVCRLVARRSARIVGAAVGAVLTWMDEDLDRCHTVAVDGSLYIGYHRYRLEVLTLLRGLFGRRADRIRIRTLKDASGIGAALVAAVAERDKGLQPCFL